MDQEQARSIISGWTREHFGKLLDVREVTVVRRATGRVWAGQLYCVSREGDIHVGQTVVADNGRIIQTLDVDRFIDALVAVRTSNNDPNALDPFADAEGNAPDDGLSDEMDFSDLGADEPIGGGDTMDAVFDMMDPGAIQEKINTLIVSGERENLLEARNLLPQLLSHQDRRGYVLQQMGELELLLGELEMGVRHLEASAREFADLANIDALAQVAEITLQIVGEQQYLRSPVRGLYDQTRIKLRPLNKLADAPLFVGMGAEEMFALEGEAHAVRIDPGEVLLREGDLANMAFIIQSGVLSIRLESPEGGSKVVRSCFPGDFIGESSVLGEPGATCTATVRGESDARLWQFDGHRLKALSLEYPEIRIRIESAKTLHQLDSFISMNESTSTLDVSMRDRLLGCITGIRRVPGGTILSPSGNVPAGVHLIVHGSIVYRTAEGVQRTYREDNFAGLRDTIHQLPLEGEFVTANDCLLVFFDPAILRGIAENASPDTIAVLEKLE